MDILYKPKSGWTLLKIVRVTLGGVILFSSAESGHIPGMIIGGLFMVISLLTDGTCCITGQGYTALNKSAGTNIENTEYEELGHK